jgi:hypothetical protein
MDSCRAFGHTRRMRVALAFGLLLAVAVAGCSGDPRSFGITGPGVQAVVPPAAAATGADTSPTPGAPTSGTYYGPSNGPITGGSGFWGYN